jgi:endonuclease/exonuclease/phosphatase family metal-dependent hydrolase
MALVFRRGEERFFFRLNKGDGIVSSMSHQTKPIRLHIATYNVHKCRGMDGRTRPSRIASVLHGLKADVVALQEVMGAGPGGRGQEEDIGARLNMESVLASARILRGHLYGNALLSRFPIDRHVTYDLSQHGYEPRLCQRVDLLMEKHPIHIYNVHLGTSRAERIRQAAQLIRILEDPKVHGPKIVLGDFNEGHRGPTSRLLSEKLDSLDLAPFLQWRRTYPGVFPVFHLDHIYYQGAVEIIKVAVPRKWLCLVASDHIPMVAEVHIG